MALTVDRYLLQLQPRAWARQVLDQVRAGVPKESRVVDLALELSGDLPRIHDGEKNRVHKLEDDSDD